MKSLRDQLDAAIDSYDMHGDPERLAMDAARAALEVVRAKHREVRPGISGGGGPLGQPKAAYVHLRDIDALLKELE